MYSERVRPQLKIFVVLVHAGIFNLIKIKAKAKVAPDKSGKNGPKGKQESGVKSTIIFPTGMRFYRGSAKNRGFGLETSDNFVKINPIFTQNV